MTRVVISQPMLFPWSGFFELAACADVFIFLDDVQFPDKSFTNRVQVKLGDKQKWMTIPIKDRTARKKITEIEALDDSWKRQHRELVRHSLAKAPYSAEALALMDRAYGPTSICELLIQSISLAAEYLGLERIQGALRSSNMNISSASSHRILELVKAVGGTRYVTAHGAANYLDHEMFAREGVDVEYIQYSLTPYSQLEESFIPYVTILDPVANLGPASKGLIRPKTVPWREFIETRRSL